jgi:non-ribosomal peptide synthase protein (TIGR01720 family)
LLVDVEGHGREELAQEVDVSRTVGWFTSVYPVLMERVESSSAAGGWEAAVLKSMKEQLREIPQRGIGYGLLRYMASDEQAGEQLSRMPQAEVSFNYLGQADHGMDQNSLFVLTGEPGGATQSASGQRRYLLEINGIIAGGELRLSWSFSENLHRRETIEALAEDYVQQLRQLIRHCEGPDAGGYTPSDFPKADLSQEELDELLAEL